MTRKPTAPPADVRLAENTTAGPGGCLLWTRAKTRCGYGVMRIGGRKGKLVYTHRLAYEIKYGAIPARLFVLHSCDRPACCNPDHLFLGTQFDNMDDMTHKGRRKLFKLTAAKVIRIRAQFAAGGVTRAQLAAEHGVSGAMLGKIISRKAWNWV